jgi:hypothetical protein
MWGSGGQLLWLVGAVTTDPRGRQIDHRTIRIRQGPIGGEHMRVRWIARGLGGFLVLTWLLILGLSAIGDEQALAGEGLLLLVLVLTGCLAIGLAWRRERLGGGLLVLDGLLLSAFAYFSAGHNRGFSILVSGAPFVVCGALFLMAEGSGKRKGSA